MKTNVKNNVWWVGKVDWDLKKFHGQEYSTHKGTSYNSYLVREGKNFIIDTVWSPFAKEYVENLKKEIDLTKIDFIIANHAEIDHSGALPELLKLIPDVPVYCTNNGIKSLKGHYHKEWNLKPVKTGDKIDIGNGKQLIVIEAPMLHWPDSMFVYMTGDNILFSNDAFGQHYATEHIFNDLVDQAELFAEAIKYYANILTPFSKLVINKIMEFVKLELPLDIICTSHGVIWRDNPMQIAEKYLEWADDYQENQVTLIYDTMWNGTRRMAEKIAEGIHKTDPETTIKLYNSATTDKNDIITEVFKSKMILVGSPTINKGILSSVAGLMEEVRGLNFKNKKAAAFGAFGWSGESVRMIAELLKKSGFEVVDEGIKEEWNPDEDAMARCVSYGENIGKTL
jgi:anaerobic nitric oxide reductase flavorubredoxin